MIFTTFLTSYCWIKRNLSSTFFIHFNFNWTRFSLNFFNFFFNCFFDFYFSRKGNSCLCIRQ